MERFTIQIPSNRICFWYKSGDTNRKPDLALVTDGDEYGMLSLSVFGVMWARHQCYTGVRHKDDPYLKERPQQAKDNGCWDYLPSQQLDEVPAAPVQKAVSPITDEQRKRIAELAAMGRSSPEIAADLTNSSGEEWSFQRVNAVLRQARESEQGA